MKKTLKNLLLILLMFCIGTVNAYAVKDENEIEIKAGQTLSLNDCIDIAINNSHDIKVYEQYVKMYSSRIGQSKSSYFPTIGASIGHEYGNTDTKYRSVQNRGSSARVSLNQLIYSFGKVFNQVKMQKFYKIAAEYDLQNEIINVTNDVKSAYYEVLAAKANADIQKANVQVNERQYNRTKAFFEEGLVSKIDLVNQEVYLSDAQISLVNAENLYQTSIIKLNNAMHVHDIPDYQIENTETFNFKTNYAEVNLLNIANNKTNDDGTIKDAVLTTQVEKNDILDNYKFSKYPYTMQECIEKAYKNHPDILSMQATENAVREALKYTKKSYFPDLTGSVGYNWNNNNYYSSNGISIGAYLSTNNLNIMETKLKVDESKSQLEIAKQNVEAIKCHVNYDVQESYVNMVQLEKNIPLLQTKVRQTLENYELADARYEVGLGNFIELQDAKENYNNAQMEYVQTIYKYNIALTNLQTAMGEK